MTIAENLSSVLSSVKKYAIISAPQREKRTFWYVLPTMTQISLRFCTVWSVFLVRVKKLCIPVYPKCVQWRFWSDCANAQADLNLRWAHTFFSGQSNRIMRKNLLVTRDWSQSRLIGSRLFRRSAAPIMAPFLMFRLMYFCRLYTSLLRFPTLFLSFSSSGDFF